MVLGLGKTYRATRHVSASVVQHADFNSQVTPDVFFDAVDHRISERKRRVWIAYVELLTDADAKCHNDSHDLDGLLERHFLEIDRQIAASLGSKAMFCRMGERLIILFDDASPAMARKLLLRVGKDIVTRDWELRRSEVHATPVIGYVDLRLRDSARDLWNMADAALEKAKLSLELEPVRYVRVAPVANRSRAAFNPARLWHNASQRFVLSLQFALSLLFGLGAPFVLYAVCDALGKDISGPVYIGVVIVLVITATTIWIEGFLALKSTKPPQEPGSPYPIATIVIPAYLPNEAATIMETLNAFLRLDYANTVQIIVAYNCPVPHMAVEDEMVALAAQYEADRRFSIEPIRVAGSTSKAQNVNAVIGRVRGRFVGIFDADHHPYADSLTRAWRWLSNGWDIVQGRCSIRNGHESWIARMIAIEFEQIYAVSHPGRARFHGFGIFGGSNGFWRTSVLHETRMRHSMLTEDIDSSIRAVVAGYRIAGDRDLISEELAPTSLSQLLNQRLRWAQGWFQVSFRRVLHTMVSPNVTLRQKLGLIHLLVWRELFPWYSIQVVPIMGYWIWIYGWEEIKWAIPIFLATSIYTISTGPGQVFIAYLLAHKPMKKKIGWFVQYLFVSMFLYSPFKDALSRVAHIKEAMREQAWKVTPRAATPRRKSVAATALSVAVLLLLLSSPKPAYAQQAPTGTFRQTLATLLGGEASTIAAARRAAKQGRQAEAARLFAQAINSVPSRRKELLREYSDALTYSGRSAEAVPLYRELIAAGPIGGEFTALSAQLALALTWSGQNREALAIYSRLAARDPTNVEFALHRARLLAGLGKPDDAIAVLDRASPDKWTIGPMAALGEATLADSARSKAQSGDIASAKRLLTRAILHNGRRDPAFIRAYAELDSGTRREVANETNGPVGTKLRSATVASMTDALVQRARTLSSMKRHDEALGAYRAIYARNPQNEEARVGIGDETVALARAAAQAGRNKDAAVFFASALKFEPTRRSGLLLDYADQVSFSGRATEAIPYYVEWLAQGQQVSERKRAMLGLANAYAWSGNSKAAAAAYRASVTAFPDDAALRWTSIVFDARDAAKNDRNVEAARLFSQAITLDPSRGDGILREYADQLTFSKQADQAIPLYLKVLANPTVSASDQLDTRKSLALAYTWTGQLREAKELYEHLAAEFPGVTEYRWIMYVVSAREAAQTNQNIAAADFFARAIELDPRKSRAILREYADQLAFTQRSTSAVGFYRIALNDPAISEVEQWLIKKSIAQAYDWSGRFAEATIAYGELVSRNPKDISLQWHYLVVRGRLAAKNDKNAEAAEFFAKAIKLLPADRKSILKEYADKLTFSGQAKRAIPLYRELLADASVSPADTRLVTLRTPAAIRDVHLALALALSWNKQLSAALREYQQLVQANPNDVDGGLGVARTLSWSGLQPEAIAAYRRVIDRQPNSNEAQRGLAQAQDWEGHHREAQATLARLLQRYPGDLEARRLLAQSLASSGRPDLALAEVRRALASPNDGTKALDDVRPRSNQTASADQAKSGKGKGTLIDNSPETAR